MHAYWTLARDMLRYRTMLVLALLFAVISGSGVAVGLAAMSPILQMLDAEGERASLLQIATDYNAGDPVIAVPPWLIDTLPADPYQGIVMLVCGLAVMTLIGSSANFLHQYLSMTVAVRSIARLRQRIFRHIMFMPLSRVVERGPAEFVSRIVKDTADLELGFRALTNKSVPKIINGAAGLMVAIAYSWQIALAAPIIGIGLGVVMKKLGKQIRRGRRASLKAQEGLLRISSEAVQGMRAVKANVGERRAAQRFHAENKRALREEMRVRTARAVSGPIAEMLGSLAVILLTIIFARQILHGDLKFEQLAVALGGLAVAGASLKPLSGILNEIYAASAPASRLMEILDEDREETRCRLMRPPRHSRSISFDGVTFTYPAGNRPALQDVDLEIMHGERVAIVGPNGCGKTTLLSMIPRLLRPGAGRVLVDGVDIESISLRALRRQIGVVTQETVLFRGSVSENIAFGAESPSMGEIVDAAKRAHAHEFIVDQLGGYEASVLEQGASMSGGQRQRLAIARAILRNPAILILDEATSQIDPESERHINAALSTFCQGRTALLIAHRMSTVLSADRIVVMDAGRVVDQGTHDELLQRCDLYQRLARQELV